MEIMIISFCRAIMLFLCLALVSGCAAINIDIPATPLSLTAEDEGRIGAVVESRLIQMLGGAYYDKEVTADLRSLCRRQKQNPGRCQITLADRSAPALYPLPGGRAILTRGLFAEGRNPKELEALLTQAMKLSESAYPDRATRGLNQAIESFLSDSPTPYAPDSPGIRMSRLFERTACAEDCLASALTPAGDKPDLSELPDSLRRLAERAPGYLLLARGRDFEESGEQAQAISTYLQAASSAPDEPRILSSLGMAYLRAGEMSSARIHLQKAVKLQPDYYRTLMGLGYLSLQSGDLGRANQLLTKSVGLLPVTENLFLLAEAREKSGDTVGARSLYRLVVESDRYSKLGRTSAGRLARKGESP